MSAVATRFGSWQRWLLGLGPIGLASLFLVRATVPTVDPLLLSIFAVLVAGTVALIAGSRIGAAVVLALGVALFQPMTAREFSFSLSATDSDAWRLWAVASLMSLGWTIVAAIVVLAVGERTDAAPPWRVGSLLGGGLALGIALVAMFPALSPQPAFGHGLDDESVAALPVIEMVNFAYDPVVVEAGTDAMYRARLVNPSDAPHTFTIEAIGLEVYVPAGRWAVLELAEDDLAGAPLAVICTIGDHLALGMAGVVEVVVDAAAETG
jgi:hypothetical protein